MPIHMVDHLALRTRQRCFHVKIVSIIHPVNHNAAVVIYRFSNLINVQHFFVSFVLTHKKRRKPLTTDSKNAILYVPDTDAFLRLASFVSSKQTGLSSYCTTIITHFLNLSSGFANIFYYFYNCK